MLPRQTIERVWEKQSGKANVTDRHDRYGTQNHYQQQQQQRKQQRADLKPLATKQPNDSLRAKWNSIGLKVECDLLQRSLVKLVRATKIKCVAQLKAGGQPPATRVKSSTAHQLKRSQSLRPTLGATSGQSSLSETATKQRSPSLRLAASPRSTNSPAHTGSQQNRPLAAFRRNEFASLSLKQQAASCKPNSSTKTLVSSFLNKSLCRTNEQKPGQLAKFRSLVGSCEQDKKTRDGRQTSGAKCSSQSIRSLLSSAAASRRHVSRKQVPNVQMLLPNGTKLLFAVEMALMLLLPLILQLAAGAPISQFARTIRPIWLADGLMTVSGSSSLDPTAEPTDTLLGKQADMDALVDRALSSLGPQQRLEQQQWAQPKRSWFSLGSAQDSNKLATPAAADTFWVERRRLERDRALEPAAWVRERPIRRDNSDARRDQRPAYQTDEASRPIRPRFVRGRQLRQSSGGLYDEVLKHLIEEALEGRAIIENIYDELESKRRLRQLQGDSSARQLPAGQSSPLGSYQQPAQSASEQDEATMRNSNLQDNASDQGVIVAGDEISNDDDISVIEVPRRPLAQQMEQQQQGQPMLAVAQKLTQLPTGAQQTADLEQMAPVGKSQATYQLASSGSSQADASPPSESQDPRGLMGSLQLASPQVQSAGEETFHVIEDIDQADNGQDISLTAADASGAPQDKPQVLQFTETPAGWEMVQNAELAGKDKRSVELGAEEPTFGRVSFGRGSALAHRQQQDTREQEVSDAEEPAGSSLAFLGRDERSASRPLNKVALQSSSRNASRAGLQPPQVTATQLIRSGFFTRAQLILFATKLRIYLENSLQLPRGAILGLFPINSRQLLAELDLNKLESVHRQSLTDNFGYVRDSSSLVLNWPSGLDNRKQITRDNPLPILIAILDALYQDDGALGDANSQRQPAQQQRKQALTNEFEASFEGDEPLERQRAQDELATARSDRSAGLRAQTAALGRRLWPSAAIYEREAPTVHLVRQSRPQLDQLPDAAALLLADGPRLDLAEGGEPDEEILLAAPPTELELDEALFSPAYKQEPLAVLASYMRSLYGLEPDESLVAALTQERVGALAREHLKLALLREQQLLVEKADAPSAGFLGRLLAAARRKSALWYDSWGSLFIVIALALMSTCLIVKLLARKFDRRFVGGRKLCSFNEHDAAGPHKHSFWSFRGRRASSSCSDESAGATISAKTTQAGPGKQLGHASSLSADSGHETLATLEAAAEPGGKSRKLLRSSLDSLTQRWAKLTSNKEAPGEAARGAEHVESALEKEASEEGASGAEAPPVKGNFRSSTSYIRSLVEAITRAATSQQMSTSTTQTSARYEPDEIDDLEAANEDNSSSSSTCLIQPDDKRAQQPRRRPAKRPQQQQLDDSDGAQEVLMSQMDISAAHLILDYMEKHLIDKERLRREWLELNAANEGAKSGHAAVGDHKQRANRSSKAQQLVLQRLAKSGLADENRAKNRDPSIVPFDRNRVRLGLGKRQRSTGSASSAGSATESVADYVNASFIYDDDPRRPTHIVAQGPTEQTCAQFWQMIWEQEISVIVMLTRLNEDGQQMCHCYWPTDVNSRSAGEQTSSSNSSSNSSALPGNGRSAAGRRGSVTSVYAGATATSGAHQQQAAGWPIVTSGELNDNVLVFELPLGQACSPDGEPALEDAATSSSRSTLRLEVHLISEHVSSSDYLVRNMYLINANTGETRTICQFHYLAWPAGRTPENVRSFLQFRRKVHKSYRNLKRPILVHCNDGAGRSGTYTLIDMILERIKNGAKEIDIRASLEYLRDQRLGLCETQSQFEFVLVALAEEIQIILNALPQ